MGVPVHTQRNGCAGKRGRHALTEAGIPVQGTVTEGSTHRVGPEHSLMELPEGQGAQGSMRVLQLIVFTYSAENTSLFYLVPQRFCLP